MTNGPAGVDESGRGPLAGPVLAGAVILDPDNPINGLADSKKLSHKQRRRLATEIQRSAVGWALGRAEVQEIDTLNILNATMLAMQRAVMALPVSPTYVFVDGNTMPQLPYPTRAIIGGDATVAEISAASIIAKVARDEEMVTLDSLYPEYGFSKHKGYATAAHLLNLKEYGVSPVHRLSFKPVSDVMEHQ